jgi:nucleoside 2-deoxyribosyltransferase
MKRLYVAGSYSSDNVIGVLDNMREGMRLSTKAFLAGFAPFCPWLDFHFQLMLKDGEHLSVDDYYKYSIAWLKASDGMLCVPGFEKSEGTKKEIAIAERLGIPVFFFLDDAISYFNKNEVTNGH